MKFFSPNWEVSQKKKKKKRVSDDFQIGYRNLKFLHVKTEIWNIKIDSVKIEKKENENETM